MPDFNFTALRELGLSTIKELEVPNGILASGSGEIYNCLFGRDQLITSLKLLDIFRKDYNLYYLELTKKVLINLALLQGEAINIENGEEPGKIIHEYRSENHDHLTKRRNKPWFVSPDNTLRNYDSIDSTPLFLIASYRYLQKSNDQDTIEQIMPNIKKAINWLLQFGDKNKDGFFDYAFHPQRKYGGLIAQNWMDSGESVFHENNEPVIFPVAPVEMQAYSFLAIKLWSFYFQDEDKNFSEFLLNRADQLKNSFNQKFIIEKDNAFSIACAIDNRGHQLSSARSSAGHLLWASLNLADDGINESILNDQFIPHLVKRLLQPDLFEPKAGIRTLSRYSRNYYSNSYHNGSIWPHDNSLIAEGFDNFGFKKEADQVRLAILTAFFYFKTPIELYVYDEDKYMEYFSARGQKACRKQAWSAAAMLAEASHLENAPAKDQDEVHQTAANSLETVVTAELG